MLYVDRTSQVAYAHHNINNQAACIGCPSSHASHEWNRHRLEWESLSYITALEPDQYVKDFFHGFIGTGHPDGAKLLDVDLAFARHNERIRSRCRK